MPCAESRKGPIISFVYLFLYILSFLLYIYMPTHFCQPQNFLDSLSVLHSTFYTFMFDLPLLKKFFISFSFLFTLFLLLYLLLLSRSLVSLSWDIMLLSSSLIFPTFIIILFYFFSLLLFRAQAQYRLDFMFLSRGK